MKITALESIQLAAYPNLVHVLVETDEGVTGLGETFLGADAVAAWIHENAAPYLLGKDPLHIERHWQALKGFVGMNSSSTENRGRSAIDIALWDIFGKVTGQPLHQLLGGKVRDSIPVYNTCAGPFYARAIPVAGEVSTNNWQLGQGDRSLEDMDAFLTDPGRLARELVAEGIAGMKMWPFDLHVGKSDGHHITAADLEATVDLFRRIRDAVGGQIDIMVDLHTLWDLPTATKIARALEEVEPAWIEDPIRPDDVGALAEFRRSTRIPTTAGETLGTRWSYRDVLEARAVDVVMTDPVWAGGVSEVRRIAAMAEAYQRPVTMHDCNGPVQFTVGVNLSVHLPNATHQESVRAYHRTWYRDLAENVAPIQDGLATPLDTPGHGVELRPDALDSPGARRRRSTAKGMDS
ncbi:mandelate racemase/muconate lactonizing enzyme family protein [Microbacterium sulfonylureivorans]|uniref:mandelate racemase/muconate lactonizing enzyme family protein n=1 Tax=Microbacterium sulfonylureivorans TaxID=2486854 RepID=UPI000FDB4A46|nr:mandelate racemase/muconate lactonizing enzyme family protein [Microbacterium sulfonylureivorans]